MEEVHYHLKEENIEKGTEIVSPQQEVTSLTFVVQGLIDLKVKDEDGNEKVLETLE